MIPRRLLNAAAVAQKLGCSLKKFESHRCTLEGLGFPPPTLHADEFGDESWDDKAIDLWLDHRIPSNLQGKTKALDLPPAHQVEAAIQQRVRGLAL